jgi:hypothetical protein
LAYFLCRSQKETERNRPMSRMYGTNWTCMSASMKKQGFRANDAYTLTGVPVACAGCPRGPEAMAALLNACTALPLHILIPWMSRGTSACTEIPIFIMTELKRRPGNSNQEIPQMLSNDTYRKGTDGLHGEGGTTGSSAY